MSIAFWIVGSYAAMAGAAYLGQRVMMYPAPGRSEKPRLAGARIVSVNAPGGRTAYALHLPAADGAPTLVHFHGNGEDLSDGTWLAAELHRRGLGFYAVEYPGYGLARTAKTTESNIYEDALAAVEHLHRSLGVPRSQIVMSGQSLGTGVAVEMAQRGWGARLVLISPFTSMVDMGRRVLPILPASLIVRDRFDSISKAPSLSMPTLVVHGDRDDLIPIAMGEKMAEAIPDAKLFVVEGAGHNDIYNRDTQRLLDRIAAFARGGS